MKDIEKAEWLADKLHNGGDYGKEAAAMLVRQAKEIEELRTSERDGWRYASELEAERKNLAEQLRAAQCR